MAPDIAKKVIEITGSEIPENQITDAIRVGHSKRGTGDLVLVREWLARELDSMRSAALSKHAVVIQSVYRAFEYKQQYQHICNSTHEIMPIFRGTLSRLDFYVKKWAYLESIARKSLTCSIRAGLSRRNYYVARTEVFRNQLIHMGQNHIYAAIMRQVYYTRKMDYIQHELQKVEVWSFSRQDKFSKKYNDDLADQKKMESYDSYLMGQEDDYVSAVAWGKEMEIFYNAKNVEEKICNEEYANACEVIKVMRKHDAEVKWREKAMKDQQEAIDGECLRRCRDMMSRMMLIQEAGPLSLPKLPPLPKADVDNNKPNHKARLEQKRYHDLVVKETHPGKLIESLAKVHQITRTTEEQKALVVKVASMIDASPTEFFHGLTVSKSTQR